MAPPGARCGARDRWVGTHEHKLGAGKETGPGVDLARKTRRYIEGLTLSGGDLDGEPFRVLPWERRFLRGALAAGVQTAAISVGRGNGKSALVAAIAAAVVDPEGPLHGSRREVVCVGPSFEQSRIIFEDVLAFLGGRYDLDDRRRWRKANTANRALLEWRKTGCRVRCIGSDPSTAHGLRPFLVLADEPAQYDPAKRDRMLSAIRTGLGKVPGSRLVALGTRPRDGRPLVRPDARGRRGLLAGSRGQGERSPIPAAHVEAGEPVTRRAPVA